VVVDSKNWVILPACHVPGIILPVMASLGVCIATFSIKVATG